MHWLNKKRNLSEIHKTLKTKQKVLVPKDLYIVKLTKKILFGDLVKNHFYLTISGGHTDTHRHMNTQTNILTYRPK